MDKASILEQICSAKGRADLFMLCIETYQFLCENQPEEQSKILSWFLKMVEEHYFSKKSKLPPSHDLTVLLDGYSCKYQNLVRGLIDAHTLNGYDEDSYYMALFTGIETLFPNITREEKGFCLLVIAQDRRTPYYELPVGLRLSDDRYSEITNDIRTSIQKSLFSFHLKRIYRTELTSRIIYLLDKLENVEQRSVFLAHFLRHCEERAIEENTNAYDSKQTTGTQNNPPNVGTMSGMTDFQVNLM